MRVLVHATCCIVNPRLTRDLSVVQPMCAPKTVFFLIFVVLSTVVGYLVGILASYAGA